MRTILTSAFILLLAAASTLLVVSPASAVQDSDCEEVRFATPGLYGLCIAYCEALDCDAEEFRAAACRPPRESVLRNYEKKQQETDPDMPCLAGIGDDVCPCFSLEDLQDLNPDHLCELETTDDGEIVTLQGASCQTQNANFPNFDLAGASDFIRPDGNTCVYRDTDESTCDSFTGTDAPDDITLEQAADCVARLKEFCGLQ